VLPYFQALFRNNTRFACKMIPVLDLSETEVKFLLGEKHLHKMKEILQCSENIDENQEEIELPANNKTSDGKRIEREDLKQPSIFDF
jgi:hypothetical protein